MAEPATTAQAPTRCGFIALIGAPNAGKSTLLNALVGAKVSIVSHKVQTTRASLRGIAIEGASQLVFIDTPGIFAPRRRLDRAMVTAAWGVAHDADLVGVLIDARRGLDEDVGAMLDQKSGDLDRAGEMQRPLAVATLGVDECRIAGDQSCELLHHAEIGGRPDVDPGAAGNERSRLFRLHLLKHAEAALLPAGPGIEIRTVGEQEIEQIEIGPRDMHGLALEAEHRLVDVGDQIAVGSQQLPHLIDIAHFNRRFKQLDWRLRR